MWNSAIELYLTKLKAYKRIGFSELIQESLIVI